MVQTFSEWMEIEAKYDVSIGTSEDNKAVLHFETKSGIAISKSFSRKQAIELIEKLTKVAEQLEK
jgi:hypothetical protein